MKLYVWNEAKAILLRNILCHSIYQEMNTLHLIHYFLRFFPSRKPKLVFDAIVINQHAYIGITFLEMIQNLLFDGSPRHDTTMRMLDNRGFHINIMLSKLHSKHFGTKFLFRRPFTHYD